MEEARHTCTLQAMTRDEFNKMLQTVQEIEIAKGFKILKLTKYYDRDRLREAVWSSPEGVVFRETLPFMEHTIYDVNPAKYRSIVYRDLWA